MLEKEWNNLLADKETYLKGKWHDLSEFKYIRQEVIASWESIRKNRFCTDMMTVPRKVSSNLLNDELKAHHFLIEITSSILKTFQNYISKDYAFYLCNTDCVILLYAGDLIESITNNSNMAGQIMDARSIGTSSHLLCLENRKPVQLVGPEHYCNDLQNVVGSSAPIFDQNDQLIGALVLNQLMPQEPWNKQNQDLFAYTLGFINVMSDEINLQLRLRSHNESLKVINDSLRESHKKIKTMNETMNTTLNLLDYGVVTIDSNGNIINANDRANEILLLDKSSNRNIVAFFDGNLQLIKKLKSGQKIGISDNYVVTINGTRYVVTTNPVNKDENGLIEIAVICFLDDETISKVAHQRSGSFANFSFDRIIGNSSKVRQVIEKAKQFSATSENILLLGESGTGKELFAQAIHNRHNAQRPFIAVNCAALPRSLIESELFGYEPGSFTGADRKGRPGKIELANGGTLFLDEIGDMPLELQAVLLRTLQDKKIMRVGGSDYLDISFRLIASTNKDLYQMAKEGLFRSDLYYRLSVLTLRLPALKERTGDIDLFINYWLEKYCQKVNMPKPKISDEVRLVFNHYEWPGNVRQLENAIIYCINSAQGGLIRLRDLPWELNPENNNEVNLEKEIEEAETLSMSEIEKKLLFKALVHTNYDIAKTAQELGMGKSTIYRKIKKYNIEF